MLRDFESYYAAGATWLAHGDPYSAAIWPREALVPGVIATRYELLPYVGPPMSLPLWALFSRLSFQTAGRLWAGVLVLAALAAVIATAVLLQRRDRWSIISLLLLAIGFGPLTSDLALGQVAIVAFAAVLVTTLFFASKYWWAGVATAIAAAVQPNLTLSLFATVKNRRTVIVLGAACAMFFACCLQASGGMRGVLHYFSVLHDHLRAERYAVIQLTPTAMAYGLGLQQNVSSLIGTTVTAGAVLFGFYCVTSRAYHRTAKLALLCAVLPFVVPFFHEHDLVIVFFPAAACAVWSGGPLRAVTAFAVVLVAVDWLGIAQRPDGTLQASLLALSTICALAIMPLRQAQGDTKNTEHDTNNTEGDTKKAHDDTNVMLSSSKHRNKFNTALRQAQGDTGNARGDTDLRMQLLPLLVIPLIVLCGFLAARHPAPIWPDAMRALPSRVHDLSAAQAWHLELACSGLIQVDAFWALLRSLSLLGCALLVLICAKVCRARSNA
ncbi:MAG: DUF2029 domain-containing protein [Candidatus Eremiobacteraeota bacterium]|nr:DUF2029 domain-containing protein [Candidatus Eremiobacteraeota bacterium]